MNDLCLVLIERIQRALASYIMESLLASMEEDQGSSSFRMKEFSVVEHFFILPDMKSLSALTLQASVLSYLVENGFADEEPFFQEYDYEGIEDRPSGFGDSGCLLDILVPLIFDDDHRDRSSSVVLY